MTTLRDKLKVHEVLLREFDFPDAAEVLAEAATRLEEYEKALKEISALPLYALGSADEAIGIARKALAASLLNEKEG